MSRIADALLCDGCHRDIDSWGCRDIWGERHYCDVACYVRQLVAQDVAGYEIGPAECRVCGKKIDGIHLAMDDGAFCDALCLADWMDWQDEIRIVKEERYVHGFATEETARAAG